MRHRAGIYASALLAALKSKSAAEQKNIIRRFVTLMVKNRDWGRRSAIVRALSS